jgi:hypothetical protein
MLATDAAGDSNSSDDGAANDTRVENDAARGTDSAVTGAADGAGDSGASDGGAADSAMVGDASANDSAQGTDGPTQDVASEATASACTADGGFPNFVKGCTNSQSCIAKLHQVDCCGTKVAIGVNHDQYTVFDNAEIAWEALCPACGCPPGSTTAEDGRTGASANVLVQCTDIDAGVGVCKTYFQ